MTEERSAAPLDDVTCVEISDPAVLNKRPLVSVKMITYNHERYIARAIEGILLQRTTFPIELVIGEDCSTDRTRQIVLDFQRRHPEVIRAVLWHRNVGMQRNGRELEGLLRGKFVAWCEGDDYWIHPRKLAMQVALMESDLRVGLVHGRYLRFNTRTQKFLRPRPARRTPSRFGDLFTQLLVGDAEHPLTCTVCMRRELLESIRKEIAAGGGEGFLSVDTQIWLEASRVTEFRMVDEPVAIYNVHAESAAHSRNVERAKRFAASRYELLLHYARKYDLQPAVERIVHEECCRPLLGLAYEAKDWQLAGSCAERLAGIGAGLDLRQRLILLGLRRRRMRPVIAAVLGFRPRQFARRALSAVFPREQDVRQEKPGGGSI